MKDTAQTILDRKIQKLTFSLEFRETRKQQNFNILNELIEIPAHKLLKERNFDERLLHELVYFMERYDKELLIRP